MEKNVDVLQGSVLRLRQFGSSAMRKLIIASHHRLAKVLNCLVVLQMACRRDDRTYIRPVGSGLHDIGGDDSEDVLTEWQGCRREAWKISGT